MIYEKKLFWGKNIKYPNKDIKKKKNYFEKKTTGISLYGYVKYTYSITDIYICIQEWIYV